MAIPKVLLFDLGGVLVEWAGPRELPKLLAASMDPEDLRVKWATSPAVGQFETGRCSEQEFATAFIDEWGLRVDRDRFLEAFSSWVVGALRWYERAAGGAARAVYARVPQQHERDALEENAADGRPEAGA
jgi:FMN phosphatase YigB (HAD superfamily)